MHENPFAALLLIENGNFLGGCTSVIVLESSMMSLSAEVAHPLLFNDTRERVIPFLLLFCFILMKYHQENKKIK